MERSVLGKGLSALIPDSVSKEKIQTVELNRIKPSSFQPRTQFRDEQLQDLANSIKEKGVIQPILVRQVGSEFELIAGERRFRAAKLLGHTEIPAIIKNVGDADVLEIALIENIQREELNKIEEARAYNRLATEFNLTQEAISQRVGKERSTIANIVRLLELPEKIKEYLEQNLITMGHAKSLLSLENEQQRVQVCEKVIKKGLSVRQTEQVVKQGISPRARKLQRSRDLHVAEAENEMQHRLGTRVRG